MSKITPEQFAIKVKRIFRDRREALSAIEILEIKALLDQIDIVWPVTASSSPFWAPGVVYEKEKG